MSVCIERQGAVDKSGDFKTSVALLLFKPWIVIEEAAVPGRTSAPSPPIFIFSEILPDTNIL